MRLGDDKDEIKIFCLSRCANLRKGVEGVERSVSFSRNKMPRASRDYCILLVSAINTTVINCVFVSESFAAIKK